MEAVAGACEIGISRKRYFICTSLTSHSRLTTFSVTTLLIPLFSFIFHLLLFSDSPSFVRHFRDLIYRPSRSKLSGKLRPLPTKYPKTFKLTSKSNDRRCTEIWNISEGRKLRESLNFDTVTRESLRMDPLFYIAQALLPKSSEKGQKKKNILGWQLSNRGFCH